MGRTVLNHAVDIVKMVPSNAVKRTVTVYKDVLMDTKEKDVKNASFYSSFVKKKPKKIMYYFVMQISFNHVITFRISMCY